MYRLAIATFSSQNNQPTEAIARAQQKANEFLLTQDPNLVRSVTAQTCQVLYQRTDDYAADEYTTHVITITYLYEGAELLG